MRCISHLSFQCTYAAVRIAAGRHHGAFCRMFHCVSFRVVRRAVGEIRRAFHCRPHRTSYRKLRRIGWDVVASAAVVGLNCANSAMPISQHIVNFTLSRARFIVRFAKRPLTHFPGRCPVSFAVQFTVHSAVHFPVHSATLSTAPSYVQIYRKYLARIFLRTYLGGYVGSDSFRRIFRRACFSAGSAAGSATDSVKDIAERRRGPSPVYSTLQLAAPPITRTGARLTVHSITYFTGKSTPLPTVPSMTHSSAACG